MMKYNAYISNQRFAGCIKLLHSEKAVAIKKKIVIISKFIIPLFPKCNPITRKTSFVTFFIYFTSNNVFQLDRTVAVDFIDFSSTLMLMLA